MSEVVADNIERRVIDMRWYHVPFIMGGLAMPILGDYMVISNTQFQNSKAKTKGQRFENYLMGGAVITGKYIVYGSILYDANREQINQFVKSLF